MTSTPFFEADETTEEYGVDGAQTEAASAVTQATHFVVVSFWQSRSNGAEGNYSYEPFADLRDAENVFLEYERGEYDRARAVGIFASRNGMPIGRVL